jgi:hypothetical protein
MFSVEGEHITADARFEFVTTAAECGYDACAEADDIVESEEHE